MKVSRLLEQFLSSLLLEANVYNLKTKYENISLEAYLESFSEHLPNAELKQLFIKKFTRLLTNDERFLYALQELPANAPSWAEQAIEKGELFYFMPTQELENQIIDIIHYLVAVYEDSQSSDPNVKAVATKELQGFPKAESIPLLIKKQQEFFARGAKSAKRDVEGMEEVITLPSGYTWYKLTSPRGFQREGQLLQNCIGRIWTLEKTNGEGMDIYVLRDPNQNSVVGARVRRNDHTLQEVKGKQNQPPVAKYMPSVQRFINDLKLTPFGSGVSDLKSAGYFFVKGRLLNRSQAIQELTTPDVLHTTKEGYITRLALNSETLELIGEAYKLQAYSMRAKMLGSSDNYIYELRDKETNQPIISVISVKKEIIKVLDFSTTDTDGGLANYSPASIAFIKQLRDREYVATMDSELISVLYWGSGLLIDKFLQSVSEDAPTDTITENGITFKMYSEEQARQIVYSFIDKVGYSYRKKEIIEGIQRLYILPILNEKKFHIAMITNDKMDQVFGCVEKTHDNNERVSFRIEAAELDQHGTIDDKAVKFFMAVANREKKTLSAKYQIQHLVTTDEKGNYKFFNAEFKKDTTSSVPAVYVDLTEYTDPADKVKALYSSLMLNGTRSKMIRNSSRSNMLYFHFAPIFHPDDKTKTLDGAYGDIYNVYSERDVAKLFPSEKMPDRVYQVKLNYGVDKHLTAGIMVKNNKIMYIDKDTLEHKLQRHEDVDTIASQLNQFAKDHKYSISPTFGNARADSVIQYVIDPKTGYFVTRASILKQKLQRAQSKATSLNQVKEMKFVDGTVIKPMDAEKFARWSRQELKRLTLAGLPFQIVKNDEVKCIFVVQYKTVIDMFTKNGNEFESTIDAEFTPYIHAMAKEFGWKTSKKLHLNYNKFNKDQLSFVGTIARAYPEGITVQRAVDNNRYVSGETRDIRKTKHADVFLKNGMITYELNGEPLVVTDDDIDPTQDYSLDQRTRRANLIRKFKMTPTGREIWLKLRDGVDMIRAVPPAELQDFKKPEVSAEVARAQGEPRERVPMEGGGSKSDLALARFREMTIANNGTMPGRSEFIRVLQAAPFNMSAAGAQTYYYNTKAKYLQQQGQVNERMTFSQFLKVLGD